MAYHLLISLLLFVVTPLYAAATTTENQSAIDYLKSLELEQLLEVEVTLDEVFDIFGALVETKKVSIATGQLQTTTHAPAITSVVTAQDIEAMGATDLDEILETVPGFHVSASDPSGAYMPIYTIRGINSFLNPEVLTLINGIPINPWSVGGRSGAWGGMPVNAIARIEVIRGPGSAVYGADAFSGVINIITKNYYDMNGTETGGRIGSFNTREAWLLHGSQWKDLKVATTLEYHDTEGPREIVEVDAQTAYDQFFGTHASLAPGPLTLPRQNLDARLDLLWGNWQFRMGLQARYDLGFGVGNAQARDPVGRYSENRFNTDLTYQTAQLFPNWEVTARLSYLNNVTKTRQDQQFFPPGAFGGLYPEGILNNAGFSEYQTRLDVFGFYSGFRQHLIRSGVGYFEGEIYKVTQLRNFGVDPATGLELPPGSGWIDVTDTPYCSYIEAGHQNWHSFLQDVWTVAPNWELTTGLRYDEYLDFGSTLNPRLALVWQTTPKLTSKLLYGRAFRAPAFLELYANDPAIMGNPQLQPETIETWEGAINYSVTESLHVAVNAFTYNLRDKILFVSGSSAESALAIAENAGQRQGHGLELEVRWKTTAKSSLLANYSFQQATDEQTDHDVGYYPRQAAYLRADWLVIPNWYLDLSTKWIGERQREWGDPRPPLAGYTMMNVTLRYKDIRQGRVNLALGLRNLLDADAREPSMGPDPTGLIGVPHDLPLAGRNYFVELRYRF